ncbi:hypothetical protein O6P43_015437 [Quillaja saponaria]|uniref:Uncharacterized protein n=1 Tax=Quillaja saponaria TaxID=32244 RepID=A0AAD7LWZ6_QUISA|nr:hypothetical protein O6P43_015437 [Quillaja saponaria]
MEEVRSSSPSKRSHETSTSRLKTNCLSFTVSLHEGFAYVKAFFVGLTKKLMAKNEREATEAELQTSKMQVEATDAAEDTKNRLNRSHVN